MKKTVTPNMEQANVTTMTEATVPSRRKMSPRVLQIILIVALVAAAAVAAYFYQENTKLKQNSQTTSQAEVKNLVDRVSRLIVLPEGEMPTVATVTDLGKLKDQVFFANAKIGDKVLIYTNAKKAILYDPGADKIVEVAPINVGNTENQPSTPK